MILIFDTDPTEAALLRSALTGMGYAAAVVPKSQYGEPLGTLAGNNLMGFPKGLNKDPVVPVLLFCSMSEEDINNALAGLRQSGLGRNALKAILTPTSQFWTVAMLAEELRREHQAMQERM